MLLQTCWDKAGVSSPLHRDKAGAVSELSVPQREHKSSRSSPVTFGHPNLWLALAAASLQRAGSPWAGTGMCCRGGSPAGSPAVPWPPLPVIPPSLAGHLLRGRSGGAGRPAAICCLHPATSPC